MRLRLYDLTKSDGYYISILARGENTTAIIAHHEEFFAISSV